MEDPDADTLASSPKPNAASSMHLHAEIGSPKHKIKQCSKHGPIRPQYHFLVQQKKSQMIIM
jgi:hypothetical protein